MTFQWIDFIYKYEIPKHIKETREEKNKRFSSLN